MSDRHQAWLDNLKVGDEVAIDGSRLEKVTRFTKTTIVVGRNRKFRKRDGCMIGATYARAEITEPTQEIRDSIERRDLHYALRAVTWRDLPLATLRKVNEMVKADATEAPR